MIISKVRVEQFFLQTSNFGIHFAKRLFDFGNGPRQSAFLPFEFLIFFISTVFRLCRLFRSTMFGFQLFQLILLFNEVIIITEILCDTFRTDIDYFRCDPVNEVPVMRNEENCTGKSSNAFSSTSLLSRSRWFVGSSNISVFDF